MNQLRTHEEKLAHIISKKGLSYSAERLHFMGYEFVSLVGDANTTLTPGSNMFWYFSEAVFYLADNDALDQVIEATLNSNSIIYPCFSSGSFGQLNVKELVCDEIITGANGGGFFGLAEKWKIN